MNAPPAWLLVVTGLFFPVITGLTLAGVVGIFRMASAFTSFRTSVELKLEANDRHHEAMQSSIERVRMELSAHADEEIRQTYDALRAAKGA